MMDDERHLSERARVLLKTLIEQYIRDGKPVGSKRLASDAGLDLSPATIRNVMSDLEEMGYIEAPHTSAGRIPTAAGYRLFVDSLLTIKPLRDSEITRLQGELTQVLNSQELATRVSALLSEISQMAGIVMLPRRERTVLRQVEFMPLTDNRVLVILVINGAEIQNRVIEVGRPYTRSELQQASNYLNEHYAGRELNEIRRLLVRELREARDHMDRAMLTMVEVAERALDTTGGDDCVVGGHTNLMSYAEMSDVDRLRQLFEAFDQKRAILDLLDHSIRADGMQIFIGQESGYAALDRCSVVAAPYRAEGEVLGVLGVIGPTRMAYDRMITIVDVTARLVGAALNSRH